MKAPGSPFEEIKFPSIHSGELEAIGRSAKEKSVDYSEKGMEEKREIFREVLIEKTSPSAQATQAHTDDTTDAAAKIKTAHKSEQLRKVLSYASTHGPLKASLMVRKIGDPWLEDQFHDMLVGLHDELVRTKQIKEE